ncbi:MAG: hypothetical protein JRJ60_12430, partial [Deltaproteobacteria bacterium]|nr:hypothetical protein [Deltaproteobacteria bacterium]
VEDILERLELQDIPRLLVLNKADLMPPGESRMLAEKMGGVAVSATDPPSLIALVEKIETFIWRGVSSPRT